MQNKIKEFFGEVFAEMKRITWPSKKDNVNYTFTVIIFVLVSALFLGATDKLIQEILKLVK